MKLYETLTEADYESMFTGKAVALFKEIFTNADAYFSKVGRACADYYLNRSGNKTISPFYEILYERKSTTVNPENVIGKTIRSKFIDKWNRIYTMLDSTDYNALDEMSIKESGIKTEEGITTVETNGNESLKVASEIKTTNNATSDKGVYGFNSADIVGTDTINNSGVTTVTGDKNKNESTSTRENTNTANTSSNESNSYTKTGRNTSGSDLLRKELEFRNDNLFFNIVFADIDSVAVQNIYY